MRISRDMQQEARQLLGQLKRLETGQETPSQPVDEGTSDKDMATSKGTKEAMALLKAGGYPLTGEGRQAVAEFMDRAPGNTKDKLEAIALAISKDIPLSGEALNALRISRTGSLVDYLRPAAASRKETLTPKGKEIQRDSGMREGAAALVKGPVIERIDSLLNQLMEVLSTEIGDKSVAFVDNRHFSGEKEGFMPTRPVDKSALSKDDKNSVRNEARSAIVGPMANSQETDLGDLKTKASDERDDGGWKSDQDLARGLEALEALVREWPGEGLVEGPSELVTGNTSVAYDYQPLEIAAKMILEQRITPRLLEIKRTFMAQVKEIGAQLEAMTKPDKGNGPIDAGQLNRIIDRLDQVVMKSEASLFMSLTNERQLIALSSLVERARTELLKGNLKGAQTDIGNVVEGLKALKLETTLKKVFGLPSFSQSNNLEGLSQAYEEGSRAFSHADKSVTGLLGFLRRIGLNHEAELYQKTYSSESLWDTSIDNLKERLIKIATHGQGQSGPTEEGTIKEVLSHITGKQLGNKLVDKAQLQQLSFSIPALVGSDGLMQHMQVMIQTPQAQLKANWKTFDMFFLLKHPQVGEIGIKVRSVDLKLSVEVINDSVNREAMFRPLIEALADDLRDFGFTATRVAFSSWTKDRESGSRGSQLHEPTKAKAIEKHEGGFDIKV